MEYICLLAVSDLFNAGMDGIHEILLMLWCLSLGHQLLSRRPRRTVVLYASVKGPIDHDSADVTKGVIDESQIKC
jgi:hypothetical protein